MHITIKDKGPLIDILVNTIISNEERYYIGFFNNGRWDYSTDKGAFPEAVVIKTVAELKAIHGKLTRDNSIRYHLSQIFCTLNIKKGVKKYA